MLLFVELLRYKSNCSRSLWKIRVLEHVSCRNSSENSVYIFCGELRFLFVLKYPVDSIEEKRWFVFIFFVYCRVLRLQTELKRKLKNKCSIGIFSTLMLIRSTLYIIILFIKSLNETVLRRDTSDFVSEFHINHSRFIYPDMKPCTQWVRNVTYPKLGLDCIGAHNWRFCSAPERYIQGVAHKIYDMCIVRDRF